jgi:hypothetical protein
MSVVTLGSRIDGYTQRQLQCPVEDDCGRGICDSFDWVVFLNGLSSTGDAITNITEFTLTDTVLEKSTRGDFLRPKVTYTFASETHHAHDVFSNRALVRTYIFQREVVGVAFLTKLRAPAKIVIRVIHFSSESERRNYSETLQKISSFNNELLPTHILQAGSKRKSGYPVVVVTRLAEFDYKALLAKNPQLQASAKAPLRVAKACLDAVIQLQASFKLLCYNIDIDDFAFVCDNGRVGAVLSNYGGCAQDSDSSRFVVRVEPAYVSPYLIKDQRHGKPEEPTSLPNTEEHAVYSFGVLLMQILDLKFADGTSVTSLISAPYATKREAVMTYRKIFENLCHPKLDRASREIIQYCSELDDEGQQSVQRIDGHRIRRNFATLTEIIKQFS